MGALSRFAWFGALVISGAATLSLIGNEGPYEPTPVTDAERADLRAYLDTYDVPLPDWSEGNVVAAGTRIAYGATGNTDAETTVFFIPGIRGQAEFFAGFVTEWHDRGYRVVVIDLPGQGRSERRAGNPEKPYTESFKKLGRIMGAAIPAIRDQLNAENVIVIGDSYGGHVLLRAAQDTALPVDHVIGMVPALGLHRGDTPEWVATAAPRVIEALGLGHLYGPIGKNWVMDAYDPDDDTYCGNRADRIRLQQAYFGLNPELRVGGITWGWIASLNRSGAHIAASAAIDEPLTIITAGKDYIVDNARAKALCEANSAGCTYIELPEAKHCLILESDAQIDTLLGHVDDAIARSKGQASTP